MSKEDVSLYFKRAEIRAAAMGVFDEDPVIVKGGIPFWVVILMMTAGFIIGTGSATALLSTLFFFAM